MIEQAGVHLIINLFLGGAARSARVGLALTVNER
jgi:hypothetical protein